MTYHLVYLLIDFYQSHLCLCTDDESSVFKSKSQGNTCIETVVTHFPSTILPKVSILNWYPPCILLL